ncbi:NAD-P-binding protein [Trametes meyenii]|nr:NAD-P-binding protein [Trametes meyenii]
MSASRPTSWLVTGSSRGIGLEIVRQLIALPNTLVVAAVRNPEKATALHGLKAGAKGSLHVVELDVSNFDSIRTLPKRLDPILGEIGLDYLVSNAAILKNDTAFTLDPESILEVVKTNVAGPALLSQVVLPYIEKGKEKKLLHISSTGGSLGSIGTIDLFTVGVTSYAISKAGLNMLVVKQKHERPDLTIITLCPGYVKTDMGGEGAWIEPAESVAGILKVITSVTNADSGKFLRHTGEEIPW